MTSQPPSASPSVKPKPPRVAWTLVEDDGTPIASGAFNNVGYAIRSLREAVERRLNQPV